MAAGLNPVGFWDLTPRLYLVIMRGVKKRAEMQARRERVFAFNVASLTRADKLPRARDFIGGEQSKLRGRDALQAMRDHAARLPKRSWEEWLKR